MEVQHKVKGLFALTMHYPTASLPEPQEAVLERAQQIAL